MWPPEPLTMNLKGPAVTVYSACSTSLAGYCTGGDSLRMDHAILPWRGQPPLQSPYKAGIFMRKAPC